MDELYAVGVGAAVGVVAGSLVQFGAARLWLKFSKNTQKQNLKKELQYNLSLVGELCDEVTRLRNTVNGNVLSSYVGYFKCSDALFLQVNALATTAALYEIFSEEHIKKLQRIISLLSAHNETWLNGRIATFRGQFIGGVDYVHADCVSFVDMIDSQFSELKGFISDISETL